MIASLKTVRIEGDIRLFSIIKTYHSVQTVLYHIIPLWFGVITETTKLL